MGEIWYGPAVWHEHFFAPDGSWFPMDAYPGSKTEELNETIGRHDAIEDERGRIFVWRAEDCMIVEFCGSREEACAKAQARATW